MKIGYPCINRSIGCRASSTFRLKNYSKENIIAKIQNNLDCLQKILEYNVKHNLLFFRISSDLVPFASHPICQFRWQEHFKNRFKEIGSYIKKHDLRISMHPDQFTLLNSPNGKIVENSIKELIYHSEVLDLMELDDSAKVQIHIGGIYGNKKQAIKRFIINYKRLPILIKRRLAIENDDKMYSLTDCLEISEDIKIPVIFDSLHHKWLNNGESITVALRRAARTWMQKDGILMTDYSSQKVNSKPGAHTDHIDIRSFTSYIEETKDINFDIMLEIKDKEKSALEALKIIKKIRDN